MKYRLTNGKEALSCAVRTEISNRVREILANEIDIDLSLAQDGWVKVISDQEFSRRQIDSYMNHVVIVSPTLVCLGIESSQQLLPTLPLDKYEYIDIWVKDMPKEGEKHEINIYKCVIAELRG